MTSNNCTTDVVVSNRQLVKNKVHLCENIQKYQEGKKTNPNSASIQRICIYVLFFLRNVLHNISQLRENKKCLGMFTVQ